MTEHVFKNSPGYDYNLELISHLRGIGSWTEYKAILDKPFSVLCGTFIGFVGSLSDFHRRRCWGDGFFFLFLATSVHL